MLDRDQDVHDAIVHVTNGRGCASAVHAVIIHVAGANMDATCGAYVVAENNISGCKLAALSNETQNLNDATQSGGKKRRYRKKTLRKKRRKKTNKKKYKSLRKKRRRK